ncbi:MAG: UDP-N-acetylmuramoyl-L-alanyl-D-glutamate--2,6-diaminopimelate ligase [Syntrophomonadaceae bacterium]|nr:UDP-N-acetylmuramoyl-L-alanyl-D-glutamate--2,6-diaminopimelate ligase [Syntrophomonadaceae bacterium]
MLLKDLLQGIKILEGRGLEQIVEGVHYDSRQIKKGYIFVCVKGYRTDGHLYIDDALSRGAVGLVVERDVEVPQGISLVRVEDSRLALAQLSANFFGHPSRLLTLIGVTGTNGKTTVTHLIEAVLRAGGKSTGIIGTIWNKIGDQKLTGVRTTPESLDLQALLNRMVAADIAAVSMEVSSHALYLHRVVGCEFDVGVFTNLTQDHLDFHKDLDEYKAAKMLLFQGLGKGRTKNRPCYAVVNIDDPVGKEIVKNTEVPVITYGVREEADVKAIDVQLTSRGTSFTAVCSKGRIPISLSLPGEFNVYNCLAALCVGLKEGVPLVLLSSALKEVKGVPGRFELVDEGQNFTVVVDYAHTPDGLENVLKTASSIKRGRLITVFGCGGDRDQGKRPLMGRLSGEISDYTVITSDNPRSEDPEKIVGQIVEGIKESKEAAYTVITDRYEAIRHALHWAREGDFVVIAGKGHETYQIIGDQVLPFDDHQVAREILVKEIIS